MLLARLGDSANPLADRAERPHRRRPRGGTALIQPTSWKLLPSPPPRPFKAAVSSPHLCARTRSRRRRRGRYRRRRPAARFCACCRTAGVRGRRRRLRRLDGGQATVMRGVLGNGLGSVGAPSHGPLPTHQRRTRPGHATRQANRTDTERRPGGPPADGDGGRGIGPDVVPLPAGGPHLQGRGAAALRRRNCGVLRRRRQEGGCVCV